MRGGRCPRELVFPVRAWRRSKELVLRAACLALRSEPNQSLHLTRPADSFPTAHLLPRQAVGVPAAAELGRSAAEAHRWVVAEELRLLLVLAVRKWLVSRPVVGLAGPWYTGDPKGMNARSVVAMARGLPPKMVYW